MCCGRALEPLAGKIRCAFVYGSIARGEEHAGSDIDVFVIGTLGLADVVAAVGERRRHSAVRSPTVYRSEDIAKHRTSGPSPGQLGVAELFLLGSDADLVPSPGPPPRATAQNDAEELDNLRAVVERDLHDAVLEGLSDDRRFATAYNAALQLGKLVLACAGYRSTGMNHHHTTIEALPLAMGPGIADTAR